MRGSCGELWTSKRARAQTHLPIRGLLMSITSVRVASIAVSIAIYLHFVSAMMAIVVDYLDSSVVAGMMAVSVLPATGQAQGAYAQNNN